jgi:membrane protease YdiL (CAAX protease family)
VARHARPVAAAVRRRAADPGRRAKRRFLPALQLWLGFLGVNAALGLAGAVLDLSSPWYDVAATAAIIALVTSFCWGARADLAPLLRGSGLDDRTWWHPIAVLVGLPLFLTAYFWVMARIGATMGSYSADFVAHGWPLWTAFLVVSVIPAVFEELAFRGFIQQRLGELMGPREAIAVQGALFSVLHMSPIIFPSHFVFGVVLGGLRRSTGSLYPGMVIHGLWNAWVLLQELRAG